MKSLLARLKAANPSRIAVVDREQSYTYADLLDRIDELAILFSNAGIRSGYSIGVALEASFDCIASWFAAWKIEGAFVAIDPTIPEERQHTYLHLCSALYSETGIEILSPYPLTDACDYVFFSSGSTGQPKGVLMPATGIECVIDAQIQKFKIGPEAHVLWMLSPGFDASLSDVLCALFSGASLYIFHKTDNGNLVDQLYQYLESKKISHADIPPSLLSRMTPEKLSPSIETIIIGGEECKKESIEIFCDRVRLVNCYGPTETTICSSMKVFRSDSEPSNIGKPIKGFEYYIEDDELWIHSPGIALAYYQGDNNVFVTLNHKRWFRSGDRVKLSKKEYFFQGRKDRQFKIRGQLVAPEEIETLLDDVLGKKGSRVEKQGDSIFAFCEGNPNMESRLVAALRNLPTWMQPVFRWVDQLPRNERNKISLDPTYDLNIFQKCMTEVLSYPVKVDDNFWTCGGDSLMAVDFIAELSSYGIALNIETLRRNPTPKLLRNTSNIVKSKAEIFEFIEALKLPPPLTYTPSPMRSCFVVGGTGFLGRHLVQHLIEQGYDVTCLVRAPDIESAKTRVPDTVTVVLGDLRKPYFGLLKNEFYSLADQCDTVFHLAANLSAGRQSDFNSIASEFQYWRLFLDHGEKKGFVFASTLSVFVNTDFEGLATEQNSDLEGVNQVYGSYAAEKILTERLVYKTFKNALILRLGLLTGDTMHGSFPPLNTLYAFIAMVLKFKEAPRSDYWKFDLSPVDLIAKKMVLLAPQKGLFHLANPHSVSLNELVCAVETHLGQPVNEISPQAFSKKLEKEGSDLSKTAFLGAARFHPPSLYQALRESDLFLASEILFSLEASKRELSVFDLETYTNKQLLSLYVRTISEQEQRNTQ